jgi:hypothetical protein
LAPASPGAPQLFFLGHATSSDFKKQNAGMKTFREPLKAFAVRGNKINKYEENKKQFAFAYVCFAKHRAAQLYKIAMASKC